MGRERHRRGKRSGGGQSAKKSEREKHPLTRKGRAGLDARRMAIKAPVALRKRICQDTKKMSEGSTHLEKGGKGSSLDSQNASMDSERPSRTLQRGAVVWQGEAKKASGKTGRQSAHEHGK